jgi:hypothetical protein
MVTKPKLKGGLGVINPRLQNEVLLLKNLDKFYNKQDLPWVKLVWSKYYSNGKVPGHTIKGSFWQRSLLRKLNVYKGIAQAVAGTGESILFWKDIWNGYLLQNQFPHLFSYVVNEDITLFSVLHQEELYDIFHLPL